MNENRKYIPESSIDAMADRFALGQVTHADIAWNAFTNQEQLDDIKWIRDRIRHGRAHLAHYMEVLNGSREDDGDNDGAAIMWLGSMLHEAWIRRNGSKP